MLPEDNAEDYGLFNPITRRRGGKIIQHIKWNPVFYSSALFSIFSLFTLILHSLWVFTFGIVLSILTVFLGIACAYICVVGKPKKPWSYLERIDIAKVVSFGLLCIAVQGLLVWGHSVLVSVHFSGEAPKWTTFPSACSTTSNNCVRVGFNITDPCGTMGVNRIEPPVYINTTPEEVFATYRDIVQKMGCHEVRSNTEIKWAHFLCITTFLGKPSDLTFQIFHKLLELPNKTPSVTPWIHSQSRYTNDNWDDNVNDAYVRLLMANAYRYYPDP